MSLIVSTYQPHLKNIFFSLILLGCTMWQMTAQAQTNPRLTAIRVGLESLEIDVPGLSETTELSVSGVPLGEFLRALAKSHELNLSIDAELKEPVTNNFSNVKVADILYFLAEDYNLDYQFTGNIIKISRFEPPADTTAYAPKQLSIAADSTNGMLTVNFKRDSIELVTRQLAETTGENIVYAPELSGKLLTLYLQNATLDKVLEQLCFSNQMRVEYATDSVYRLLPPEPKNDQNTRNQSISSRKRRMSSGVTFVNNEDTTYTLLAENQPLNQIVKAVFSELDVNLFYYAEPQGNLTVETTGKNVDEILRQIFFGTQYTFRKVDGNYYIGERIQEGMRATERLHLQYRSIEKVREYIPAGLLKDLEVVEFPELNSLIVSGSYPQIQELGAYFKEIDQPVPVIQIEVIIIDYNRSHDISAGIEMGLGESPAKSGGKINPGVDYTLGAQTINQIISSFNGFGSLNMGPVTPNFYIGLRALETNGIIKTRSTPRLATLNGHEANISIGRTEYYAVEQQTLQGVQNPIPIITRNYNSVQADFSLKIKPFVSGEGQVTLEIEVQQSDFTGRIAPDAPPGQQTRKFNTIIRVLNEDMILIGGLEEKSKEETGSGLPWLSRVPVIKWLFSSRNKVKSDNRLNIFIKPTIIK